MVMKMLVMFGCCVLLEDVVGALVVGFFVVV